MAMIATPAQRIEADIREVQALLEGETEIAAIEHYSSLIFALEDLLKGDIIDQLVYGYDRRMCDNIGMAVDRFERTK